MNMLKNVAIVVALLACSSLLGNNYVSLADEVGKDTKYYDKINEHLVKKVDSEDVEANMLELRRWFQGKRSVFKSGSTLWPAVERVLKMQDICDNSARCYSFDFDVMEDNDRGLANSIRLNQDNYALQRTDKLVQHYFLEYAMKCSNKIYRLSSPLVYFGWKRKAYMKLNQLVRSSLAPGDTMAKVKDLLKKLEKEQPEGALTDVARQIVSIENVLGAYRCTHEGYEILLSNELGVRDFSEQPGKAEDLLDLVKGAVTLHHQLCQNTWPEMYEAKLRELDEKTLRSLAVMISEFYFHQYGKSNPELTEGIEHSKYPQINADLSTPEVLELVSRLNSKVNSDNLRLIQPQDLRHMTYADGLPLNLKKFIPESHPDYKTFTLGRYSEFEIVAPRLFSEYVMEPCKRYLNTIEKILVPSMHNTIGGSSVADIPSGEVEERLGLVLGQAVMDMCDSALYYERADGKDLRDLLRTLDRYRREN